MISYDEVMVWEDDDGWHAVILGEAEAVSYSRGHAIKLLGEKLIEP